MAVAKTRTFRSGNSEAIRLPKDVAFGKTLNSSSFGPEMC